MFRRKGGAPPLLGFNALRARVQERLQQWRSLAGVVLLPSVAVSLRHRFAVGFAHRRSFALFASLIRFTRARAHFSRHPCGCSSSSRRRLSCPQLFFPVGFGHVAPPHCLPSHSFFSPVRPPLDSKMLRSAFSIFSYRTKRGVIAVHCIGSDSAIALCSIAALCADTPAAHPELNITRSVCHAALRLCTHGVAVGALARAFYMRRSHGVCW